ncbi:hypothetical protein [Vibrio fluvialis]|uniref:hypothetical protein n=1 Tax=Vibrio fluvialis TaxID=676 RepID=UPI0037E2EA7E
MKLRSKMFISYVVVAVLFTAVSCIALGWLVYKDASEALATSAKERMVISRNESASQIERYFDTVASQAQNMSHDLSILDAVKGFTQAFMDYPVRSDDNEALRNYYRNEFAGRYHRHQHHRQHQRRQLVWQGVGPRQNAAKPVHCTQPESSGQ